ncbi:uncharacterized protein LOC112904234 [Agrilus planipennis]|uniref:Uncharacterized protein LOC112904234 n=1 Tax=Agrilus planipennis TaxID=224129 RepID=A0A7F5R349_AGRPL|nr:uncharacterized protein LOC112904234 [Agrilus planipennis]
MSDEDSEMESSEDVTTEMMFIAERVKAFPEILEKSQVPAIKRKKTAALTQIVKEYVTLFGKGMEIKAFMKKVNNMKTRLKNKTDRNKTGNKPIRLLSWERIMLKAMHADINPVLSQVPGAFAIGVPTQPPLPTLRNDIMTEKIVPNKLSPKPRDVCGKPEESDETKQLTTAQLQRLVFVEQLKVARLQQQYFSAKLQQLDETYNK